jgi:hypothetical protein
MNTKFRQTHFCGLTAWVYDPYGDKEEYAYVYLEYTKDDLERIAQVIETPLSTTDHQDGKGGTSETWYDIRFDELAVAYAAINPAQIKEKSSSTGWGKEPVVEVYRSMFNELVLVAEDYKYGNARSEETRRLKRFEAESKVLERSRHQPGQALRESVYAVSELIEGWNRDYLQTLAGHLKNPEKWKWENEPVVMTLVEQEIAAAKEYMRIREEKYELMGQLINRKVEALEIPEIGKKAVQEESVDIPYDFTVGAGL